MNNNALLDQRRAARQGATVPALINPTPGMVPAGVTPGGLDESRIDSAGAALSVGAAVPGGPPGLFLSARGPRALGNDPVAAAVEPGGDPEYGYGAGKPPPSRFTLRQTSTPSTGTSAGGRMMTPAETFRNTATDVALQRILATPTAAGGSPAPGPAGGVPPLLSAAASLQNTRLSAAADDIAARLRPNVPTAAQPAGFRDSNALYMSKLLTDQAARNPQLAPGGRPPTVEDMAAAGNRLAQDSNLPRLITVGTDAQGRPIQRIYNPRTGNDEKLPTTEITHGPAFELEQLHAALDAANKAGKKELAVSLKRTIDNYHNSANLLAQLFAGGAGAEPGAGPAAGETAGGGAEAASAAPAAAAAEDLPVLTPEQAAKAKPGTRFKTTDGRIHVRK